MEKIRSKANLIGHLAGSIKSMAVSTKNWEELLFVKAGLKKEATARFRDGSLLGGISRKNFRTYLAANFAKKAGIDAAIGDKSISFSYKNKKLSFLASPQDFLSILECFNGEYSRMDVSGRDVVDVGAFIGDTSVYFAMNGARKVIGYEPFFHSFTLARENAKTNGMSSSIVFENAAVGKSTGMLRMDGNAVNTSGDIAKDVGGDASVPIVTLKQIADKYGISDGALKIDCEGAEYDIIPNASRETLRRFRSIILEFHYGSARITKALEAAGFQVSMVAGPLSVSNPSSKTGRMLIGILFASRIGDSAANQKKV